MGDVAFPCFSLARILKKAPQSIAEDMRTQLLTESATVFSKIEVIGGYINFHLDKIEVLKLFFNKAKNSLLVDFSDYEGKTVTIEHTSVNPNASPHIGRARNAMIGDASVRLLRFLGCDVKVHYFANDIGKQIALLAYCTKDKSEISFGELLSLYVAANEELKTNPDLENEVFRVLNRMENGDKDVFSVFSAANSFCENDRPVNTSQLYPFMQIFRVSKNLIQPFHKRDQITIIQCPVIHQEIETEKFSRCNFFFAIGRCDTTGALGQTADANNANLRRDNLQQNGGRIRSMIK
jgi:arginyl-tRNA synthetase